jgi:uncharacterized protein
MSPSDPDLTHRAKQVEQQLLEQINDPHAAVIIATEDGFDLGHAHAPRAQVEPGRLAAMASSTSAIGDVVGRETGLGTTQCLVAEMSDGYVVMRSARYGATRVVLTAMASRQAVLGLLMHAVSSSAREFEA